MREKNRREKKTGKGNSADKNQMSMEDSIKKMVSFKTDGKRTTRKAKEMEELKKESLRR